MRLRASDTVRSWLDAQDRENLFTTTIAQAEILFGIDSLPNGKRKSRLLQAAEGTFSTDFERQILYFDERAARVYASLLSTRNRLGRPMSQSDAMIASICRSHGAIIATRNVRDFQDCGIEIVDPWNS